MRIEVEASQDRGIEIPHAFRLNADRIEVVGEKGAGPASITQEFQADREGRRQADAHQPAGAACRSHTEPDRATHPPRRSVSAS